MLVLAAAVSSLAAQPVLVKDIRTAPDPRASIPSLFDAASLGADLYFGEDDGFFGDELWRSDGTAAGTRQVADLCPGRCSAFPEHFTAAGGLLFFLARDGVHGRELWRSDGTAAGTFLLLDGVPGPEDSLSFYPFLARFGPRLLFATRSGESTSLLWTSDGTRAGTQPFVEIEGHLESQRPAAAGGVLVFALGVAGQGVKLWRTDGTAAGTGPLASIDLGIGSGAFSRFEPTAAGGRLYFAGFDDASGAEPWTTDGTAEGTRRLADLAPGEDSSLPFSFTVRDGEVVFTAEAPATGREIWRTDGTTAGTRLVADLRPGPASSQPVILASARGRLLFAADDGLHGSEPWLIAASGALVSLGDLNPGPPGSTAFSDGGAAAGLLFFTAETPAAGRELWRTDGTAAGTRLARDLTPGPAGTIFGPLRPVNDRILFGFERRTQPGVAWLGASAGSPATTGVVTAIDKRVGSSDPAQLTTLVARVVFTADDGVHGREVWTSDGRRLGTALLGDLSPPTPDFDFGPTELTGPFFDRAMFFTGLGTALWSTRGVPGDARLLRGRQRLLHGLNPVHGNAVFFGSEWREGELSLVVWRSDGTAEGTRRVETVARDESPEFGGDLLAVSVSDFGRVYFVPHREVFIFGVGAIGRHSGLWVSDGTADGTFEAVPDPCGGCGRVLTLETVGHTGRIFYVTESRSSETGLYRELWTSDLTPEGTRRLLRAEQIHADFVALEFAGRAFLVAGDAEHGKELWTSDGTPEGTRLVADLWPGPDPAYPVSLTARGHEVFFAADDGVHGRELWISDGTEAGTRMVADLRPGPLSSHPQALRALDGYLFLAADDGVHGLEPWRSDGTFGGTFLLGDVLAGRRSSSPRDFAVAGEWLLFNAGRPAAGYELFRLPRFTATPPND